MGLFDRLKKKDEIIMVTLNLNMKLQPMHRFDLEDFFQELLEKHHLGELDGGGSLMNKEGEIISCDIGFNIFKNKLDEFVSRVKQIKMIAKGSYLIFEDEKIELGFSEGLGLYLNGTDLNEDVYKNNDINELIEKLDKITEGKAIRMSYFEGGKETALYYYGISYEEIKECINVVTRSHPLCQQCRIVQIA